jgi:hypothetical protein
MVTVITQMNMSSNPDDWNNTKNLLFTGVGILKVKIKDGSQFIERFYLGIALIYLILIHPMILIGM